MYGKADAKQLGQAEDLSDTGQHISKEGHNLHYKTNTDRAIIDCPATAFVEFHKDSDHVRNESHDRDQHAHCCQCRSGIACPLRFRHVSDNRRKNVSWGSMNDRYARGKGQRTHKFY